MKRSRVWRIILIIILIFVMCFAIIASVDNGSPVGNYLKQSGFVFNIKNKYKDIIQEALSIKVAPI